jgi:hypothetical protein
MMEFESRPPISEFLTLKIRCDIPTADRLQHFLEELKNDLDTEERSRVANGVSQNVAQRHRTWR